LLAIAFLLTACGRLGFEPLGVGGVSDSGSIIDGDGAIGDGAIGDGAIGDGAIGDGGDGGSSVRGELDPTFGVDGVLVISTDIDAEVESAFDIEPAPSGGYLIVGTRDYLTSAEMQLVRITDDGDINTSVMDEGFRRLSPGSTRSHARRLLPDGDRFWIVGDADGTDSDVAVLRIDEDGVLDTGFNGTGVMTVDLGGDDRARGASIAGDGLFICATPDDQDVAAVLMDGTGALVPSFGTGGIAALNRPGAANGCYGAAVVGSGFVGTGSVGGEMRVWKWTTQGMLDSTFADGGDLFVHEGWGGSLIVDGSGRLLLTGRFGGILAGGFSSARILASGQLDTTYGTDGISGPGTPGVTSVVATMPGGRLVVAGEAYASDLSTHYASLIMLTADGLLDTSFGDEGVLTIVNRAAINDLTIDASGRIVAVGNVIVDGEGTRMFVARIQ
jgi:uncharacterized delta-60 repeat protein